ncbi:DinB family protein [Desulfosporosinus sp.]|uniref:DinB family protein n=1 Tax=Desulfosporosinus sp. TaxID=157907 RepID=UPI00231A7AAE|nr:DinB family protein [Desulfosporosinus sp.]MCO5388654.1 DinB family protein [Desulfosporosinus sp.]MDA8221106.1 DinB family protein [Desulfitobacterium hafniense]
MFTSLATFLLSWEKESESTSKILDSLTDDSLNQSVTIDDRTLGRIAWHIVTTIPEMLEKTGLVFGGIKENAPVPNTAKTIADSYREVNKSMLTEIKKHWNDQTLLEERDMYGESWTIGTTLNVLINHQIHHRGQMTVLMRQAGLKVPGIMGPSREDWGQFGMEAPTV